MSESTHFGRSLLGLLFVLTAAPIAAADDESAFGTFRGPVIAPHSRARLSRIAEIDKFAWRIEFNADGTQVAFVGWGGPVEIRSLADFKLLPEFSSSQGPIAFDFGPTKYVAYCENSRIAVLQNVESGEAVELATGNSQPDVKFSPNGELLITGGYGTEAKLWSVPDGALVRTLSNGNHEGGLTPVFSSDGKLVAVGNRNSTTTIFETATGNVVHVLNREMSHELAFSPDGTKLAVTYVHGELRLWDVRTGELLEELASGAKELYTVSWSPDGNLIAAAGLHDDLIVADANSLKGVTPLDTPEWTIRVRFTPDGRRLLASGGSLTDTTDRHVILYGVPAD